MYLSSHMPCAECGESVERSAADAHTCDPERRLDFLMLALRHQVSGFEHSMREFLSCKEGQFEVWLAARVVRGGA